MEESHDNIRIGYWWSEKKTKKFNVKNFTQYCQANGLELVKFNFDQPLEEQGPFSLILHKLSDIVVKADLGNPDAILALKAFETYIENHPEIIIVDPLPNVCKLLNRCEQYQLVKDCSLGKSGEVFTPNFVELTTSDVKENSDRLRRFNVNYPIVCKPVLAHGSTLAHQMCLVFGDDGLKDVTPPCVAQTFVCHNATLYKIFIIGKKHFIIERPSLKNFRAGSTDRETIFFDSHDISKPNSASSLIKMDEDDHHTVTMSPDPERVEKIVKVLQENLGLDLFGIDLIIDSSNGSYAIIDMNVFPGYDGVENVWEPMCQLVLEKLGLQCEEKYNEQEEELEGGGVMTPNKISYCANCCISFKNLTDVCSNCAKRTLTLTEGFSFEVSKATAVTSHNSDISCTEDSGIDMSEECDKSKSKQGGGPSKFARKQYTKKSIASNATTGKLICR